MKRLLHLGTWTCLSWICLIALPGLGAGTAAGDDNPTFRTLVREYFETGNGEKLADFIGYDKPVKKVIALEYKVLLLQDGTERPVDPKLHKFRLGDRIRVSIQPLADYHIYIFNIGPGGEKGFLLPDESRNELAPLVRAGKNVVLPDDGYLRFAPPSGTEQLMVVATEKRLADRAALASILSKDPGEEDTPAEKAVRQSIKATVKEALISVREREKARKDSTVMYRGLSTEEEISAMAEDVRARGVAEGTFEEASRGGAKGTSAMYVSTLPKGESRLLVHIPLTSVSTNPAK